MPKTQIEEASPQPTEALQHFILGEWDRKVPDAVGVAAKAIADGFGSGSLGVLFYGSCLRTGEIEDKVLDFYVIVDDYKSAYEKSWLATANQILPPNVFYHEIDVDGMTVRSKYAVVSLQDFQFRCSSSCLNVSIWARFCQPCMLMLPQNEDVRLSVANAVGTAIQTMLQNLLDLKPWATQSRDLWVAAFEATYAAELRSERGGKGLEIYLLDQARYDDLTPIALTALGVEDAVSQEQAPITQPARTDKFPAKLAWFLRRWNGKVVSFLRLVKASMTFDGGIDYLAWKIRRHSGVEIEIKDWMRKHPVFAGIFLFWSLRKKGAFK